MRVFCIVLGKWCASCRRLGAVKTEVKKGSSGARCHSGGRARHTPAGSIWGLNSAEWYIVGHNTQGQHWKHGWPCSAKMIEIIFIFSHRDSDPFFTDPGPGCDKKQNYLVSFAVTRKQGREAVATFGNPWMNQAGLSPYHLYYICRKY